ncbi:NAD-dependent epimerase/dehydratase family protein [Paracoccaceae bacterium]|nr:NAD-dependent epimerase/dehydratase family protein [Paracoccaceae bacterium]
MTNFIDTTILIVGGAGFVGSNLARLLLLEKPAKIIIIDNLISSDIRNIPKSTKVEFHCGSVNDQRILAKLPQKIDFIFHLACYHGNQSSIADPFADHTNNTLSSLSLFDFVANNISVQKVVYAAAACAVAEKTYDKPSVTTEDQPISLYHDSPYSISKIIGELYGNYYFQRENLPFVKARFSNVYGPGEILGAGQWRGTIHTVWRNVIPSFIWKSLNKESLPLDNGGNTSRDFIFVEDMARGLMACASKGTPGEVYNLATGRETSILDIANMINAITGNSVPPTIEPPRDWDRSGKRYASIEKSKNFLGFEANVNVKLGLEKTIQWTLNNGEIISENIKRHSEHIKS